MYVFMYVCMSVCVCLSVCLSVCMYVCIYVCTIEWGESGLNLSCSALCHFITVRWLSLTWLLQFWLEKGYSSLKTKKYGLGVKFSHFLRKIRIFKKSFFQRMSKFLYWPTKMGRGRCKLMVFLEIPTKNIITQWNTFVVPCFEISQKSTFYCILS